MSEQPNVRPGDKIAVQIGDELIEDTIHSVRYTSATPVIYRDMKWWESLLRHRRLRRVVPARLRQPIQPVRAAKPAQTEIIMTGDHGRRLQRTMEDMNRRLNEILR